MPKVSSVGKGKNKGTVVATTKRTPNKAAQQADAARQAEIAKALKKQGKKVGPKGTRYIVE